MTSALLFFFFPSLLVNYTNCRFIVHGYIYLQLYLIYEFVYIIYRQNIWSVIELLLLSKAMHVQCLREREREGQWQQQQPAGIWWVRQVEGRRERRTQTADADAERLSPRDSRNGYWRRQNILRELTVHLKYLPTTVASISPIEHSPTQVPRNFVSSYHFTMHFHSISSLFLLDWVLYPLLIIIRY